MRKKTRAEESGRPYDLVLIGFGNAVRSDDGAGPAVIERLRREAVPPRVALADAFQLTPELADLAGQSDRLILIDASVDQAPGTIDLRRLMSVAKPGIGHRLEPTQFLMLARQLRGGPRRAAAYTIGVESLEYGEGLSEPVANAVARLASRIVKRLARRLPLADAG